MEETKCPVCGSTNISRTEYRRFTQENGEWNEAVEIIPDYGCNDCDHEWE